MPVTRRDFWIGIAILAVVVLLHAAIPRYDWSESGSGLLRFDRWTGRVQAHGLVNGQWSIVDLPRAR